MSMLLPVPLADTDLHLGTSVGRVTALMGASSGKYPSGNSVLVCGTTESLLIDPSLTVANRGGVPLASRVDRMLVSHSHEDHLAGCATFPNAALHAHHHDVLGLQSLDGILTVYGFEDPVRNAWGKTLVDEFNYVARPDAAGFADGDRFDLGDISVTVVHLPGHTRGHCGFLIEPDGVMFVADIDLTSFGPYYGDHWSDLEDFERAIARVAEIDARHYVTFHHKGVVSERSEFLRALTAFGSVISDRERRLLDFLKEPHTIDEVVTHRFIYRPGVELPFADHVERTSMQMHIVRLLRDGSLHEPEPGLYRSA